MKHLLTLALLLHVVASAEPLGMYHTGKVEPGWSPEDAECVGQTCWPLDGPKMPIVIFLNHGTPEGLTVAGQWYSIDLTPFVPAGHDMALAHLGGLMIISAGAAAERCTMDVYLRAPGSAVERHIGRVTTDSVYGGVRNTIYVTVPVVNNRIEFTWDRSTSSRYPAGCNYGINLSLQAWFLR